MRPGPLEAAACWVYGSLPDAPHPGSRSSPRRALDDVIRPALTNGPCFVTFSGGRDSSAVLAAATALARREDLPLPIPVTKVYPDLPEADEESWQRMVIEHLGLADWVRLEFRNGEAELLGDAARAAVRRHGVLWPPAMQAAEAVYTRIGAGSLLTGEGGDAVLGPRRIDPLLALGRSRRPHRRLLSAAAVAASPRPVRRRIVERAVSESHQSRWLRPEALARHARLYADDTAAERLRADLGAWSYTRLRAFATVTHNRVASAAEHGIRASDPLLDPGFVAALAREGGRRGFGGRTATMTALFADVLPPALLARGTKASFGRAHNGEGTRAFAREWDGTGVDHALVDADRLRAVWLSDQPTMAAGVLLHQAWLAAGGPEL
ncbi:asparagine synthase-related protein [Nocardioides sp. YIM 152588]|uniref:asparagine synthase-related protein n=1 Tax=Nocardioides sp. YIM 152588 TaxID=3158259 RepID=UPI0032E4BE8C